MDQHPLSDADRRGLARISKSLVEVCVRNTGLEDLHGGIFPASETGDFSDVKIVSPFGEIPWTRLSRISDEEMKRLMIEIVDKVYTFLIYPAELAVLSAQTRRWDRPRLDPDLMDVVQRRKAYRSAGPPDVSS
jgi:hypothetical protein